VVPETGSYNGCGGGGVCRYLKCDLETFDLRDLESKFDVILIEPPLEEYQRTLGVTYDKYWSWDMVSTLSAVLVLLLSVSDEVLAWLSVWSEVQMICI